MLSLLSADDLFLMLAFYGDDSGSHGKGPFVVAGYLARTGDWFDIERKWEVALHAEPRLDYFKMGECYWLKGQFEGWDRKIADSKLDSLIDVVCGFTPKMAEVSSVMWWEDYDSIIGTGKFKEVFHSPYFFCLHGVVAEAARRLKDTDEKIHFVLDHQSNLNHDSALQYYRVRETAPKEITRYMGAISHEDDKEFVLLQVADLIAWHCRRDWAKPPQDGGTQRPALVRLRENLWIGKCARWNAAKVAQLVVDTEEGLAKLWKQQSSKMPTPNNPEYDAFTRTLDKLLSVPHEELKKRMDAYKREAAKNPIRRGPKPKVKRKVGR